MHQAHLGLQICAAAILASLASAASAPLAIGPSVKYSFSGTSVMDTSPYAATSAVVDLAYRITFPRAMNDTSYKSTIALQQIYAQLSNREFSLYFDLDYKQKTALNFFIQSSRLNKIQSLTFRYLVVASVWGTFAGWWNIYTTSPGVTITSSSPYIDIVTGLDPVSMTSNIVVFSVLTGFEIVASSSANQLSLLIDVTILTSTSIRVVMSTYSSQPITLNAVSYSQISFDVNEINAIPGRVHVGFFNSSTPGPFSYLNGAQIAMSYNTIFGLRGFHIINQGFLSWNLTLYPGVSIQATSNNAFRYFNFIYLILEESWCPFPIPYLLVATQTCYDVCPERYYSKELSWTCEPCLYDCYLCEGPTNCTQCNETTDFRIMDNGTSRCIPLEGYYDDGMSHSQALPCIAPCLACSSVSVCVSCNLSYYLTGGTCQPCASNCLNCTSATNCVECILPYQLSGSSCILNCGSLISNCTACQVVANTTEVKCTECQLGFSLQVGINCSIICGDGILASNEGCDDGNLVDSDGCSSLCTVEPASYCLGSVGNTSNCFACSDHCLNCTSSNDCSLCEPLYVYNVTECAANCSAVEYCNSCLVNGGASGDYVQCVNCVEGYSVERASNECKPVCGDGLVTPQQACDDGNLKAGDGCSSTCEVEQYYACNQSLTTNASQCFLTELALDLVTITKNQGQNSGIMYFTPSPKDLPIYSSIDWASLITIDSPNIVLTTATYDPDTGQVVAHFDYHATIDGDSFTVSLNTTGDTPLSRVTNSSVQIKATAANNQAFVYYSDEDYQTAKIVKYLSLVCSVFAILLLLIGLFGGRLIGLECAAVIQLTFVSLISVENISPAFAELSGLAYSLGYNRIRGYETRQDIDRPFRGLQISQQYIYNYNIVGVILLIPLLAAVIFKILAKASSAQSKARWIQRVKLAAGEYTLYLFVFFSYLAYLSLFVDLKYQARTIGTIDYIDFAVASLLCLFGILYCFVYCRGDSCFTEFKDKFELGFGQKYYIFPILERIVSPAIMVALSSQFVANASIIAVSAVLGVLILKGQPYKGHRKNYRPFTNYLLVILIQLIFLIVGLARDPSSVLSLYGPLIILALLIVCLIYSVYALVKQVKQGLEREEQKSQLGEEAKMKEFTEQLMRESNVSIFRKASYEESPVELGSPSRMQVSAVRQRLSSLKLTNLNLSEREELLDRTSDPIQTIEIPSELEEDSI